VNELEVLTMLAGHILLEAKKTIAAAAAVAQKEPSLVNDEGFREDRWEYLDRWERSEAVEAVIKRMVKGQRP